MDSTWWPINSIGVGSESLIESGTDFYCLWRGGRVRLWRQTTVAFWSFPLRSLPWSWPWSSWNPREICSIAGKWRGNLILTCRCSRHRRSHADCFVFRAVRREFLWILSLSLSVSQRNPMPKRCRLFLDSGRVSCRGRDGGDRPQRADGSPSHDLRSASEAFWLLGQLFISDVYLLDVIPVVTDQCNCFCDSCVIRETSGLSSRRSRWRFLSGLQWLWRSVGSAPLDHQDGYQSVRRPSFPSLVFLCCSRLVKLFQRSECI